MANNCFGVVNWAYGLVMTLVGGHSRHTTQLTCDDNNLALALPLDFVNSVQFHKN